MSKLIEKLRDFISGLIPYAPIGSTNLGFRLETIKPTNLGIQTWRWIKLIIKSAFESVCDKLINLSLSTGKQLGVLGYNAQYPYIQKALCGYIGDNTIVVYDGTAPDAVVVMPSQEENTVIIDEGTIVYPANAYILAPFVIHSTNALSAATRNRICAEVNRLKFAGVRFTIDAPYPAYQPQEEEIAPDEPATIIQ